MSGRVILITGSSKGIGEALARHYLSVGEQVVGISRSRPQWDTEIPGYTHYLADVGDEQAISEVFTVLRKNGGQLDALINNAGVAAMNHALLTPLSSAEQILRTNTLGTFLLCREAAKLMRRHGGGRIVNFSSVALPLNLEGEALYAASKAAVVSLTRTLAREFAPYGITVNAVGPTPVKTALLGGVPEQKIEALLKRQALRRYGTFEDIINVVDFFLRPQSDFITAQVLYLGGV